MLRPAALTESKTLERQVVNMDMGDMKSKDIGKLVSAGLVSKGAETLAAEVQEAQSLSGVQAAAETRNASRGQVPGTVKNQNLGHNSKKEGLGPNTKR